MNAGAVIDILDTKQTKQKLTQKATQLDGEAVQAAGFVGGTQNNGMSTWEWWASAGGLVAIAACMTLLVIRQRRFSN
ncbi:hypothetical protein G7066_13030 [Leucobacter coleopterorum]|uniref:LPXTG-motif cell wall anchor domain-containing protein n=1 Tax=Leucobacter coleopterorum TaxID=2714933 RepID=A0ABX6JY76_9MICO|nr:hypothetical protein [Leucobacter coleopterorum]QIM19256.1 hypothetical protein G7066_13030 [Leucobacter coleopterorum]